MRQDLLLKLIRRIHRIGRQRQARRFDDLKPRPAGQVERRADHPVPAVQVHVGRVAAGVQDDHRVVDHLPAVPQLPVDAPALPRRPREVRPQEGAGPGPTSRTTAIAAPPGGVRRMARLAFKWNP